MKDCSSTDSQHLEFDPKSPSQREEARKEIARLKAENEKLIVKYTANEAAIHALNAKLPPPLIQVGIEPVLPCNNATCS